MALQVPFMYDYPGAVHAEPAGRLATGEHALYGWYRCSDGYIFMATKGDDQALQTVSQVAFLEAVFTQIIGSAQEVIHSPLLKQLLQEQFSKVSKAFALEALERAGVAATAQGFMADLRSQNITTAKNF